MPLASMVAVSPRRETAFPRIRTALFVNESRYLALMRGVASEAMFDMLEDGECDGLARSAKTFNATARDKTWRRNERPPEISWLYK